MAIKEGIEGDLVRFEWKRPLQGHTWFDRSGQNTDEDKLFLIPKIGSFAFGQGYIGISPMSERELFRIFAKIKPNPDSIRKFADKYGWLGVDEELNGGLWGESIVKWKTHIREMQNLLELWECVGTEPPDILRLEELIKVDRTGSNEHWFYSFPNGTIDSITSIQVGEYGAIGDRSSLEETLIKQHGIVGAAWAHLLWTMNRYMHDSIAPNLYYSSTGLGVTLKLRPRRLLGAMWLQFAQTITHTRSFTRCEVCGSFLPLEKGRRSTRLYCGSACRARHYRQKKMQQTKPL